MIGKKVEFPVDLCTYLVGRVIRFDELTGTLTVIDRDGHQWEGEEYQVSILDDLPEDQPVLN